MTHVVAGCQRCQSPLEHGDLRCAVCGLVVEREGAIEHRGLVTRFLRCESCSAAVAYDARAGAPHCAFCDATMVIEETLDPLEQTETWLPFTVGADEARRALDDWLGRQGFFRPPDLRRRARLESLRPLWWVGWVFDALALISWTADSDHDAGRSDWAPHAGQTMLEFDDIVVSASRGLSDEETRALAPACDLATAADTPRGPEGAVQEQFDVQRSQARQRVMTAIEAVATERVKSGHVPGRRFRNVHAAPLLKKLETRRFAFPAWVMAWRYEGELYRTVVCGQDARVVLGKAPWSVARIVLVVAIVLALVLLVVAAIVAR